MIKINVNKYLNFLEIQYLNLSIPSLVYDSSFWAEASNDFFKVNMWLRCNTAIKKSLAIAPLPE